MPEFGDSVNFNNLPATNFVLPVTTPSELSGGSIKYNPTTKHPEVYNETSWVPVGQITDSGPISSVANNDGTFTVTVATATPSSAGLMSAANADMLAGATATGAAGELVLWNASSGLTANVTGNLAGTASNASNLGGQPPSYYLDLGNATGTLPASAGGLGFSAANAQNGQVPIGTGSGLALSVISAGPGIVITNGSGSITVAANVTGAVAPIGASYVVISNDPTLTSERVLTPAAGQLTLTDAGAGSTVTLGLSAVIVAGQQSPKVTVDEFGRVLSSTALTSSDIPQITKSKISDFVEGDYVHTTGDENIAGNKTFTNNVIVSGDLYVSGSTTTISSQQLIVKDNVIVINSGETGPGVTNISAGIAVDRGTSGTYYFAFFEDSDTFRIGETGTMQAVATRADSIPNNAVVKWDDVSKTLVDSGIASNTVLTTGSSLNGGNLVSGSVPNSALTNSSLSVNAGSGLTGGGSVSLGGSTTLSLEMTGASGTYTKVTTDAYGRVIAGSALTSGDLPAHTQAWSTITNTPTTLAGYGITDAVNTFGDQTVNGSKNFGLTPTVSGSYTVYHSGNLTATTLGAITGVGLSVPNFLNVSPAVVSSPSGTFNVTLATQTSGSVFAGPANGAAVAPTFRTLVASDIPAVNASSIVGQVDVAHGGTGASTVSGARIALSVASIAMATITGNSANKTFVITNVFGNPNVIVQVVRSLGSPLGDVIIPTVNIAQTTPYAITINFGKNVPTGTDYTVLMTGVGA